MVTALQAGNDDSLLKTRGGVLQSAGLRVVSTKGLADALRHIQYCTFDVAILCHSLTSSERAALAAAVHRRNPAAPVLLVQSARDGRDGRPVGIDQILDSHPQILLATLRAVLNLSGGARVQGSQPVSIAEVRSRPN